jgi:hypothetical protein
MSSRDATTAFQAESEIGGSWRSLEPDATMMTTLVRPSVVADTLQPVFALGGHPDRGALHFASSRFRNWICSRRTGSGANRRVPSSHSLG